MECPPLPQSGGTGWFSSLTKSWEPRFANKLEIFFFGLGSPHYFGAVLVSSVLCGLGKWLSFPVSLNHIFIKMLFKTGLLGSQGKSKPSLLWLVTCDSSIATENIGFPKTNGKYLWMLKLTLFAVDILGPESGEQCILHSLQYMLNWMVEIGSPWLVWKNQHQAQGTIRLLHYQGNGVTEPQNICWGLFFRALTFIHGLEMRACMG